MSTVNPAPQERLYLKLLEAGYDLQTKRLDDNNPDTLFVGYHFETQDGAFTYRLEDNDETVFLMRYQSLKPKQGLSNSFKGFFWFLNFIAQPDLKLKRITSSISIKQDEENNGFSTLRFVELLQKIGGIQTPSNDGTIMLSFDLANTSTFKKQYRLFSKLKA